MQKKIDIDSLRPFLSLSQDNATVSYQENILEFLEKLKNETLLSKKLQIDEAEKQLHASA